MHSSYIDLLKLGRTTLEKFSEIGITHDENYTGIEESLGGIFLAQMLELNNYIYTTSSTNHPGTKTQCFFIGFQAPEELCMKIVQQLDPIKYGYSLVSLRIKDNELTSVPLILHYVPSNDPTGSFYDTHSIQRSKNNPRRLSKSASQDIVGSAFYQEFPNMLISEYAYTIKKDKICNMTITDTDIYDESLYLVLIDILRKIVD